MKKMIKMSCAVFALVQTARLWAEPVHQEPPQATVTVDFTRVTGKVKPMHGVGQPPINGWDFSMFPYLKRAGIPYSRLHDVGGWLGGGLYIDIPNIFRDFDADETKPESYDFGMSDQIVKFLTYQNCEPFFRLGVTIENFHPFRTFRINPPKDFAKWARVCEHVIRHYREGWADGFTFDIKYWEIWNEPDSSVNPKENLMWTGTPEQYFELYDVTAKHLKACFGDAIKVGGPASCGFYAWKDADTAVRHPGSWETRCATFIDFARNFLAYTKAHGSPIDFFSYHTYSQTEDAIDQARFCQKLLDEHGYGHVEKILNEWNTCYDRRDRARPVAAARALAFMLAHQKTTIDLLCYYDARIGATCYGGLFNPDTWRPYLAYYAFSSFNRAYRLGGEVATACDEAGVFTLGATDGKKRLLLLANTRDRAVTLKLDLKGAGVVADVHRIDDENTYTRTGEDLSDGTIELPPYGCAEIEFASSQEN